MTHTTTRINADTTAYVDVKLLKLGMSPRFGGQDIDHAQALAFRLDDCPPILVERSTSTVIDGVHRVLAARMLGRTTIVARFFEGTHEEAFLEAVRSNIAHGKPLTLAEREAAAKKVLGIHCDWSDRLVGDICGLSDKTVGRLRKTTADIPQLSARVGRDGRQRPTDPQPLRNQIAAALREKPGAKLEDIAASLSTSPSTVRDVRKRLQRGDDPAGRTGASERRTGAALRRGLLRFAVSGRTARDRRPGKPWTGALTKRFSRYPEVASWPSGSSRRGSIRTSGRRWSPRFHWAASPS